jgi:hypothetical protein
MASPGPLDIVRPFLWIALAAFLCGFGGYVLLAVAHPPARPQVEVVRWLQPPADAGSLRAV